ncbi:AraC family transcriptional regulator [Pectobacterium atrosepticum]|uniref:AraC family transcriptional regulator n=1 Tax=Pectobacterium atrosepticum TaxID=29471 RepID=UPI00039FBBEF|nr:AraC family transcriptional regulator [Pectobacterium atrosepticum]GKV84569.1 AraC family transcriptional regulator [Pectobacterium carotovorum subsp. carotovorum]AIA72035.1 AraC family transcriptional regulator [Pectobacterium atrosepticum]AIK15002.1 AraC-family transcriptional regulator [Pectobacterium atrosepticum]ATY91780.1 AraC family transcriptional regulator [Pectobacterium atrosepticum]KFX15124.1 AraC family transcriptional regulator [Pectobacterium atrosepticum]
MNDTLLNLCRRYADACADHNGVTVTPVPGLTIVRSLHPGELQAAVSKPLIAMLLQGRKRVTTGPDSFEYGPGEAMVISADIPTVSQITQASKGAPYYSLVLELDIEILRELQVVMPTKISNASGNIHIESICDDLADTAYRLVKLFGQHEALNILGKGLIRELHYWLLRSKHGSAIRALGAVDSHAGRVSRAIAILRKDFMRSIRIQELASAAGMSVSVFHQYFRSLTTLTPLQFQKQLRLINARNLMLTNGVGITHAASAVGYASVSQFTREYARMFNIPPGRDIRLIRSSASQE